MKTAYLLPGQGSQSPGMLDRFDASDEQRLIDRASEILSSDVRKISRNDPSGILDQTQWTQPLLLLCSILALGRLEEEAPSVVLGHSLGEYSAYVAAGALPLD